VYTSATTSASTAVAYPEPVPISSTRCVESGASASSMSATTYGCEMVWDSAIESAESS
jgi:hypothetical protein